MLYIVQNNRAYHQEHMYLTAMAARRSRGIEKAHIGTTLTDPNIDFATVAQGFGVHGEGPVTDPNDGLLRPRWPDLYGVNADLLQQLSLLVHCDRMGVIGPAGTAISGPPCIGRVEAL